MIQAAAETIVEVRHKDPGQLVRLAWHLGNRHLPTEIRHEALRIRPDHVIEEMLSSFGAILEKVDAPFQPEGGAYGVATITITAMMNHLSSVVFRRWRFFDCKAGFRPRSLRVFTATPMVSNGLSKHVTYAIGKVWSTGWKRIFAMAQDETRRSFSKKHGVVPRSHDHGG